MKIRKYISKKLVREHDTYSGNHVDFGLKGSESGKRFNELLSRIRFKKTWTHDNEQLNDSFDKIWTRIESSEIKTPKSIYNYRYFAIAATFAILFTSGFFLYYYLKSNDTVQLTEVVTPLGKKTRIKLPDNSVVWLNAGSRLIYPKVFNSKQREVRVSGEAFFNITKNKKQPFLVKTGMLTIKVLGTSFNIKSYPEDKIIETTLTEGSISLILPSKTSNDEPIILKPNQQAQFQKNTQQLNLKEVDTEVFTSWRKGIFTFENQTFSEIAISLERSFNIKVIITNDALKNKRLSAKFLNGETLTQILDLISINARFHYTIEDNVVTITQTTSNDY